MSKSEAVSAVEVCSTADKLASAQKKLASANKAKAKFKSDLTVAENELALTSGKLEIALNTQGANAALSAAVNNAVILIQSYIVLANARGTSTVQVDEVKLIGQLLSGSANQSGDLLLIGADS